MVSRDTTVHAAVVLLALAAAATLNVVAPDMGESMLIGVALVLYGLLLGGSHLVLALRGEGGLVPVAARWRFLALVAVSLCLAAVVLLTDPVAVGPVTSDGILSAVWVASVLGYWLLEARAGYLDAGVENGQRS